jgi:hypothetical protein
MMGLSEGFGHLEIRIKDITSDLSSLNGNQQEVVMSHGVDSGPALTAITY